MKAIVVTDQAVGTAGMTLVERVGAENSDHAVFSFAG
jgi:hypothetical protein